MNVHEAWELKQMQSLPLEAKIRMTQDRIKSWYESWTRFDIVNDATGKKRSVTLDTRDRWAKPDLKPSEWIEAEWPGAVCVNFSGGVDSTVLKHIVDSMYDDVPSMFVNTGLEYPEIQQFVKDVKSGKWDCFNPDVVIVRPEMRFDEVLKKYGYPVIGKKQSEVIGLARKNIEQGKYSLRLRTLGVTPEEAENLGLELPSEEMLARYEKTADGSIYNIPQYKYLLDAEFDVSAYCCTVMKKNPLFRYQKETGRKPFLGTMAHESTIRKSAWLKNGCNAFDSVHPASTPLAFWTKQDVLHYIKKYDVPYCPVYGDIQIKQVVDNDRVFEGQINMIDYLGCYEQEDTLETTGCDRTGCIFCMFGCHLEKEPNRFQRLKQTHPRQYEYCIGGGEMVDGKWLPSKEGLGLGKVLDYIGVKYD